MLSKFLVVDGNLTQLASLLDHIGDYLIDLEYNGDLFEQIMKNQNKLQRSLIHIEGHDEGSSSSHGN